MVKDFGPRMGKVGNKEWELEKACSLVGRVKGEGLL